MLNTHQHNIVHRDLKPANILFNNKGVALGNLKRHDEALVALEEAIHLDPNNADAYFAKGNALNYLEKSKEAGQAYKKACQLGYTG